MHLGGNVKHTNRSDLCVRENFVRGCENDVWIKVLFNNDQPTVLIDSDSQLVRGVGSVVSSVLSKCTKDQIAELKYNDFKELFKYLPVARQRGVQIILNKIQQLCV